MDTMRLVSISTAQIMMLAILFLGQSEGQAVIFNGPRDEIVAPGEIAYFNCYAQGDDVYWYIERRIPSGTESDYEERGFTFDSQEVNSQVNEYNWTITVEARPSNNKTRIACEVNSGSSGHAFQEGTLIIAGPPLTPLVTHNVEYDSSNDSFVINFNWNESFTWAGFPVISYTYSLWNESSGQRIDHNTMWLNASDAFIDNYQFTTEGQYCYMLTFSISAGNSLGMGNVTESTIGHPIKAGEIGEIETVVTFHLNGTPHFWMSFSAPQICPEYQTLTYNITVYRSVDYSVIHHFGLTNIVQHNNNERALIVKELRTGLNTSEDYEVVVITESIGSLESRRKTFDTNVMCAADIIPCQPCRSGGGNIDRAPESSISGAVIGIIISILVIVFLLVIIIILIILIARQRKIKISKYSGSGDATDGQSLRKNAPRKVESSNPIYEGAVYETTPGESIKPLLISSSSLTPSLDLTPHYVDLPPNLPPPRESDLPDTQPHLETVDEIDAIKASIKKHECPNLYGTNGDEYMIMGPNKMKKDM